jgi:hypothetical protein
VPKPSKAKVSQKCRRQAENWEGAIPKPIWLDSRYPNYADDKRDVQTN